MLGSRAVSFLRLAVKCCVTRGHRHHQNLANRTRLLQLAEDRRKAEERENKQREMHDLLTFVQGQIHGKEAQDFKLSIRESR